MQIGLIRRYNYLISLLVHFVSPGDFQFSANNGNLQKLHFPVKIKITAELMLIVFGCKSLPGVLEAIENFWCNELQKHKNSAKLLYLGSFISGKHAFLFNPKCLFFFNFQWTFLWSLSKWESIYQRELQIIIQTTLNTMTNKMLHL